MIATAAALVAAFAVGMIAYHFTFTGANADSHGSEGVATVRIAAMRDGEGDVRVALQQQAASGAWGERQLPTRRVLRTNAPTNEWRTSSALQVRIMEPPVAAGPLFCIIAHGEPNDLFWIMLRAHSYLAAHLSNVNLRFESHPDGADQAAAINRCRIDGAVAIASTLAQPDAVTDALLAAKSEGTRIVTYNSGADHAAAAGAEIHIALDDWEAGRRAAAEFNRLDVSGWIGCLLHERGNVGLEKRCDALEQDYNGAGVVRIQLTPGGGEHQQEIVARLTDHNEIEIDALLALNVDTLFNAARAADEVYQQTDRVVKVSSIGTRITVIREIPAEVRNRHINALISDSVYAQGFLTLSAMQLLVNGATSTRTNAKPEIWLSTPFTADVQAGRGDLEQVRQSVQRLLQLEREAAANQN